MESNSSGKLVHWRGQAIHSKERVVTCNVVVYCDKEGKDMELSAPIKKTEIFKRCSQVTDNGMPFVLNVRVFQQFKSYWHGTMTLGWHLARCNNFKVK